MPLVALVVAACATSAEPPQDLEYEENRTGGTSGVDGSGGHQTASGGNPMAQAGTVNPPGGRANSAGAGSSAAGSAAGTGPANSAGRANGVAGASGGTVGAGSPAGSSGRASGGTKSSGGSGGSGATSGRGSGGRSGQSGAGGRGDASAGSVGSAGEESSGGTGGGTPVFACDAKSAVAHVEHSKTASIKSDDCIELVLNPSWSSVNVTIEGQPGTSGYPIPFSYSVCNGKSGTGTLTANYIKEEVFKGTNPGCNVFVQFEGTGTALTLIHYD